MRNDYRNNFMMSRLFMLLIPMSEATAAPAQIAREIARGARFPCRIRALALLSGNMLHW
jgi:hypothetical protein